MVSPRLCFTNPQPVAFPLSPDGLILRAWSQTRAEASQHLRAMIDKVVLTPTESGEELTVDLIGDLAGILSVATTMESSRIAAELSKLQQVYQELSGRTTKAPEGALTLGSTLQVDLVAGARFKRGLPDPEFPLTPAQAALVAGARRKRSLLHAAWDLSAVQRPKTEIDYDALLGLPSLTFP